MNTVLVVLICTGVFFLCAGAVGIIRFTDTYSRMHAAGKCDTLGVLLVLIGLACYQGIGTTGLKIFLIAAFVFLTSPTATHVIARAALKHHFTVFPKEGP